MEFFEGLQQILGRDIGARGFVSAVRPAPLRELAKTLATAKRVLLLTGFPVCCLDGTVCGETDGPGGTANMAAAFLAAGCRVAVLTDEVNAPVVKAALCARAPSAELVCMPRTDVAAFARALMETFCPTHLVSLERPGKAEDGHFHNMRGEIIDAMVQDTDLFLPLAKEAGAVTIAIGDGGNELGMGTYRREIIASVPRGKEIAAVYPADITLVSGVSNWWGWGVAALLSRNKGAMLLPSAAQEAELLRCVVAAGAVDGCTKKSELSVDALPLSVHLALLEEIRALVDGAMAPCAKGA